MNYSKEKSLGRSVLTALGTVDNKPPRMLSQFSNGKGYLSVQLYSKDKTKRVYVHRLSLRSFLGDSVLVVNHKDHIRDNNRLSNLEYSTQRENTSSSKNKPKPASKYTGVIRTTNLYKKWGAIIRINKRKYYLGGFLTEIEAHNSYKNALYMWESFSITPKGSYEEETETLAFITKSGGHRGVNAKEVLDTYTGIYYDSLKEACTALNLKYKSQSELLCKRPHKTSLIYV